MAKKVAIFFLLFLLVIFQVSVLSNFFPENSIPNILLILLIFWTARKGLEKTWKLAILGGVLSDLLLFSPIGTSVFSFFIAIFAVNYLAKRFLVTHQTWRFAILVVLVFVGIFLNELAAYILVKLFFIFHKTAASAQLFFDSALALKIFYSIIIFALLYRPVKKIEAFFNLYGSRTDSKSNVR